LSTEPQLDALVAKVIPAIRQHLEFEENDVWPELRRASLLAIQLAKAEAQ
jgi:hypothetical protein